MNNKTPYSIETERAILSILLRDGAKINKVKDVLKAIDFYDPKNEIIYKVILEIYKKGVIPDIETVSSELKQQKSLEEVGSSAYIVELASQLSANPDNLMHYVNKLKGLLYRRDGIKSLDRIREKFFDESIEEPILAEELEGELSQLRIKKQTIGIDLKPYTLKKFLKEIREAPEGLKTGYTELDRIISIPSEAITIIAGRPSHGKTTFMLNLLINMIKMYQDKTFLFFSYEENRHKIALKIIHILTQGNSKAPDTKVIREWIREGSDSHSLQTSYTTFKNLTESSRLWIIDEPFCIKDLTSIIGYLSDRCSIGAVFIDYIQKIKIKEKYITRQVELQKICQTILETANSHSIPIIMGAQLGRGQGYQDKVRLDNLREAGDIEQDANMVIGLYNEAMEKAQSRRNNEVSIPDVSDLKLTILKNRDGRVNDTISLEFDRPALKIRTLYPAI